MRSEAARRAVLAVGLTSLAGGAAGPACAESPVYLPSNPAFVIASVPGAGLARLRRAQRAAPDDPTAAVALVQALLDRARLDGDPRHHGEARAVLAPWWDVTDPPPALRLWRATLRQALHDFEAAADDLARLIDAPAAGEAATRAAATLTRAAIRQVQGRHEEAAADCERLLAPDTPPAAVLPAQACLADLATLGRVPGPGRTLLHRLDAGEAGPPWLARLRAEAAERAGDLDIAERLHRRAVAGRPEVLALTALADLLGDQGRWAEVLVLLQGRPEAEALRLRRARAAQALGLPEAATLRRGLEATAAARARRGDVTHAREDAWRLLHLEARPADALAWAEANWAVQKEPADARLLLEAAQAANRPAAADPVRAWLRVRGLQDRRLQPWGVPDPRLPALGRSDR